MIIDFVFWLLIALIAHTYVFYPILLGLLAKNRKPNQHTYALANELPMLSVVMAAYNEEAVIGTKIQSIFNTSYPLHKLEVLIGSDNSSDQTNAIIESFQGQYPMLKLQAFSSRNGKAKIINQLAEQAQGEVLILTDANVFFTKDTLYHLAKHYKNPGVAVVGGNIHNTNIKDDGISHQEKSYIDRENIIKYQEGVLWGSMVGAFGGIYAIRKSYYAPVPRNYFMDDFYITMHAIGAGGQAINELEAVCHEDVSNLISEEFRRKVRISIGNFQNLSSFYKLLFPPHTGVAFSFLSHKVLRWTTPFLMLMILVLSLVLAADSMFYRVLLLLQALLYIAPLADYILKQIKAHNKLLRFASHFVGMNAALLLGFFKYLKGVNTNVWEPTKRNQ